MTVSEAPDGWFIEYNNRFYHVNEGWLEDMHRHQVKPYGNNPAYNQLYAAFHRGASSEVILERFRDFIDNRQRPPKPKGSDPSEFQQFIKERRAARNT